MFENFLAKYRMWWDTSVACLSTQIDIINMANKGQQLRGHVSRTQTAPAPPNGIKTPIKQNILFDCC